MNQPKQPPNPPEGGASPASNPTGETPHGIPRGVEDHEPKGRPTSDREQTESAPAKS
jgi:hypothetical protein